MSRGRSGTIRPLPLALAVLVILALAPTRFTRWIGALRDPVNFVIQPVSHPLATLSRNLRPAETGPADDPRVAALEAQREDLAARLARARQRIDDLERLVAELQAGYAVAPELEIRAFAAPVTGSSTNASDTALRIGAGTAQGVQPLSSVAVSGGFHLVGRVIEVGRASCLVLPITEERTGWIEALVMVDDPDLAFRGQFRPAGDGSLAGDMEQGARDIAPGQIVRLNDATWPAGAQQLQIGRVTEIERQPNGRLRVTLRPEIDPRRVSEVVLRVPVTEGAP
jgi:cell shape-determining protein MreC